MFWIFGKRGCLVGTVDLDECAAELCGVGDGTKRRQQVEASGVCPKLRIGVGVFVGSKASVQRFVCRPRCLFVDTRKGSPYGCGEIFLMLDGA